MFAAQQRLQSKKNFPNNSDLLYEEMAKRATFAFELAKPSKRGMLMKQGSLHKAFKYRYFVLYPGFLVYYATENKWKVDLAKGETLGVSTSVALPLVLKGRTSCAHAPPVERNV